MRVKSEVDPPRVLKAAGAQRHADQQNQAQGDLGHHQRAAQAEAVVRGCAGAASLFQCVVQVRPCSLQRRRESEQNSRGEGRHGSEAEDGSVEPQVVADGERCSRHQLDEEINTPRCQRAPERAPQSRQGDPHLVLGDPILRDARERDAVAVELAALDRDLLLGAARIAQDGLQLDAEKEGQRGNDEEPAADAQDRPKRPCQQGDDKGNR